MAMSSQAAGNKPPGEAGMVARGRVAVHPVWLRLTHWLNALAVVLMLLSGWRIYNGSPIFDFRFPRDFTLGGWLGGALQWHFAAMWLLAANGVIYLALNTGTRRLWRKFLPLHPPAIPRHLLARFGGRFNHSDPAHSTA